MKNFTKIKFALMLALAVCFSRISAQNTCATAVPINCGDATFGSTLGVANDNGSSGAITCLTTLGTGGQQWYSFTATDNGTGIFSTVNASTAAFDSKIHVYSGACGGLGCVAGNDDFGGTLQSQVTFTFTNGTTYYIRIGGFLAAAGNYQLTFDCDLASDGCTNPIACNFDPIATNDDGSCCVGNCITLELFDLFGDSWDEDTYTLATSPGGNVVSTGTLAGATSSQFLCLADGEYTMTVTGDGVFFGDIGWEFSATNEEVLSGQFLGEIGSGTGTFLFGVNVIVNPGCNDINATNYDPSATIDDGSCVYCDAGEQILVFTMFDGFGDGWNGAQYIVFNSVTNNVVFQGTLAAGDEGTFVDCLAPGCYSIQVTGGTFPGEVSWTLGPLDGAILFSGGANETYGFTWAGQTGCVINGCTNANSNNYNPFATNDDGSCILPPVNDACAAAQAIGCGQTITGTTVNANPDPNAGTCSGIAITSPGVWYTFIGTGQQATATTCGGTAGDSKISVYTGNCTTPVCVAANDDGCPTGFLSSVSFSTVNGFAYYILVSEFGPGVGIPFTLSLTCTDCPQIPINDVCTSALPIVQGVNFPGNLCCSNPDADIEPWDPFGTQYGIWYTINTGSAEAISIEFWNGSGPGNDAGDGTDVGIGVFQEGPNGCTNLIPLVGGVGFDGSPTDGFIFNSYEFEGQGVIILPNTDYYFLLTTSDPINCGDFVLNVTLSNVGCTDPLACNYDVVNDIDNGTCEYITCSAVPVNNLCANAVALTCNSTVNSSTGGSTNTGAPTVCPVGANDAGVWFTFTGGGQFVTLSTCGSPIDSRITIVSSANGCAGPYTCVASEDNDATADGCGTFNADDASVSFISVIGTLYYVYITAGATDTNGDFANDLFDGAFTLDFQCAPVIEGCTDACACNYNANANVEDDNCDYFSCEGCTAGSQAVRLNMTDDFGDGWNGSTYVIEDLAGNEVATGDLDDAECGNGTDAGFDVFCLEDGCYVITVGGGFFLGEVAWTLESSTGAEIATGGALAADNTVSFTIGAGLCGCTDSGACNFDPAATDDDGSCESETCAGCTDNTACNFDPTATISAPTDCCFGNCVTFLMTDLFGDGWNGASANITNSSTGLIVATAGLPTGGNGTATFCLPDGCYTITVGGGTFDGEIGWTLIGVTGGALSGTAVEDLSFSTGGINCTPGCTEPIACNYDPAATVSDCNLCEYLSCQGCTYANATNYDAVALIDDGSCIIEGGSNSCPADLDENGIVGVSDLVIFLGAYGNVCPN